MKIGTLSRKATILFHFCLPSHYWSTLKEKNLLPEEQILSLKSRSDFRRTTSTQTAVNRNSRKLFPLVKMATKHGDVSIHLKLSAANTAVEFSVRHWSLRLSTITPNFAYASFIKLISELLYHGRDIYCVV